MTPSAFRDRKGKLTHHVSRGTWKAVQWSTFLPKSTWCLETGGVTALDVTMLRLAR
jgi:hypothetical protein